MRTLVAWAVDSVFVLGPLLLCAWALDRLVLRRLDPRFVHGVWLIMLARLLAPPVLLPWPPSVGQIEAVSTAPWLATAAEGSLAVTGHLLAAVWAAGLCVVTAWWSVRGWHAARRLSRDGAAAPACTSRVARLLSDAGIARPLSVVVDPLATAPYVIGLVRPCLVLPPDVLAWPAEQFEHIVRHELAHLRRGDLWLEAAWMAACAIYWFHPLVHVARRRAYEARELCCDAEVAGLVGPEYRSTLLRMAARCVDGPPPAPPQHGWHPVIWRVKALERQRGRRSRRATCAGAIALALVALFSLPLHIRLPAARPPAVDLAGLVDQTRRLELGRGSLHVRYALMQQMHTQESTR